MSDFKKAILREALKCWSRGFVYDPEMLNKEPIETVETKISRKKKFAHVDEVALKREEKEKRKVNKGKTK